MAGTNDLRIVKYFLIILAEDVPGPSLRAGIPMFGDDIRFQSHLHSRPTRTRREFVRDAFAGFSGLALASILHQEEVRAGVSPLAPKPVHMPAKARSVIFLFMAGGPSHLETFDPKPLLNKLEGQRRPKEFGEVKYQQIKSNAKLLGTRRSFKKYGQSGIEVSDLFPRIATANLDRAIPLTSPPHTRWLSVDVPHRERFHGLQYARDWAIQQAQSLKFEFIRG